jgi:hypothetical protein
MDTEKCPFIGIDCEYIPLARKSDAQAKEIERLRKELKESNANHELYERRWYLRENEIERLRNNQSILITSFRINMMRLCPDYSHEEFDKDIAVMLKEKE